MPNLTLTGICFIACHGGPADHFAAYAESLSKERRTISIAASGPALKKIQERKQVVQYPFSLDGLSAEQEDELADQLARACSASSVVLTDVGNAFTVKLHKALEAKKIRHLAYYDNPEPYVPGGYSTAAAGAMLAAEGVLFANANLAQEAIYREPGQVLDLGNRKRIGIGYYPLQQAEDIAKRRESEQALMRANLLDKLGLEDKGQRILVYFGGNNEVYFNQAFPAFLTALSDSLNQADLSNIVIVIHQHPAPKANHRDADQVMKWQEQSGHHAQVPKLVLSDLTTDEAQVLADAALYYQTSMAPQFVLAHIPTIQIGHEAYEDSLVRNGLCESVTDAPHFIRAVQHLGQDRKDSHQLICDGLGIKKDWLERLNQAFKEMKSSFINSLITKLHLKEIIQASWRPALSMASLALIGYLAFRALRI